jgi:RNA polymerase sigma-70 factor (ECF subfamily)
LNLTDNHFYFALLGELYKTIDKKKSKEHFITALSLAKSPADKQTIKIKLDNL